jgi:general stress protein YciG
MPTDDTKAKNHSTSLAPADRSMTTSEAGRKGGEKVRDERGPKFYSEIGRMQGKDNNPGNFANDPQKASEAGRKGGHNSHRNHTTA